MDTRELVIAAQDGNASAMNRLLAEWRPHLVRRAQSFMRHDSAAQDIVQETLLRVAVRLGDLNDAEAFASWVYTILQRNASEYYRREARQGRDAISFDESFASDAAAEVQASLDAGSELADCVGRLATADRDLLRLHYWGGIELREIARGLGIATGAVKTRLFRARERLSAVLADGAGPSALLSN